MGFVVFDVMVWYVYGCLFVVFGVCDVDVLLYVV